MIIKKGNKFALMSKDGTKQLGEFDNKAQALKRERQINYFKWKKKK